MVTQHISGKTMPGPSTAIPVVYIVLPAGSSYNRPLDMVWEAFKVLIKLVQIVPIYLILIVARLLNSTWIIIFEWNGTSLNKLLKYLPKLSLQITPAPSLDPQSSEVLYEHSNNLSSCPLQEMPSMAKVELTLPKRDSLVFS